MTVKGVVQVVFNPEESKTAWEVADQCRSEYVVEITGTVIRRDKNSVNPKWLQVILKLRVKKFYPK